MHLLYFFSNAEGILWSLIRKKSSLNLVSYCFREWDYEGFNTHITILKIIEIIVLLVLLS